jgi:PAS domain S-box-containing protein
MRYSRKAKTGHAGGSERVGGTGEQDNRIGAGEARDAIAQALAAVDIGIAVFDAVRRFVTCNQHYRDLLPAGEAVLQPGTEYWIVMVDHAETVFDPSEKPRLSLIAAQETEEPPSSPQVFRCRDGRWLELRRHERDDGGFVCLWTDVTPRLEAQTELVHLQARLRDAVQSMPDGFVLLDGDGRIALHNTAFAEHYGLPPEPGMAGLSYGAFLQRLLDQGRLADVPPDGSSERQAWLDGMLARHREPDGPIELRLTDGRWLRVSETRTLDGGIVGIHSDISEIRRREAELARRTALLDAVTRAATRIVGRGDWQIGIEDLLSRLGQILHVDRAGLYRVSSGGGGAIVQVCLFEWAAPGTAPARTTTGRLDTGDGTLDGWLLRLRRGQPIRGLTADLSGPLRRLLEARGVRSHLAVPIIIGGEWWGHVAFDDTQGGRTWSLRETEVLRTAATMLSSAIQRAMLDEELGKSEARKQAIVDTALDCVLTIDSSGVLVEYNPAAERTLGWSRREALGRRMDELMIPPEHRKPHREGLARFLADGDSRVLGRRIEMAALRRDGSTFPCELALTASRVGEEQFFTAYLRDITERKETERAMAEARLRAEAAARAKNLFLNNMSHELRTPLNAVIGFSEIIKEEVLGPLGTPKYKEFAADILDSGKHLLEVINDVLDMSRIEAGERSLVKEPLDLFEVVQSCAGMVSDRAAKAGVALSVDVAPGAVPVADRRAAMKIVLNLLSNAVKFTPPGGAVAVTATAAADGGVDLAIADTGIGIPPEAMDRVFEPFQQAEMDLNRQHEGVGLGLPMARALVELHGGTIRLDSAVGRGTVARVHFPRDEDAQPPLSP